MHASKAADTYGLFPGHNIEQADARQAYTQCTLKGTETYVRLPYDAWPEEWKARDMWDPVCPLRLSLYGHPDSGGYWEQHCESHVLVKGFENIESWRSCYYLPPRAEYVYDHLRG